MGLIDKARQATRLVVLVADLHRGIKDLPTVFNLDEFLSAHKSGAAQGPNSKTLDLGCGPQPQNPFHAQQVFGLDIRPNPQLNIKYADLTVDAIPYSDNEFDYLTAFEFLEHVPRVIYLPGRRFPFVELMSEVWRVLKPGGLFLSSTPIYPFSAAFRDPTHVNLMTHETFSLYFDDKHRGASMYGFHGSFEILKQRRCGSNLMSLLCKVA
jgi:SAM-dependent methyltransferase